MWSIAGRHAVVLEDGLSEPPLEHAIERPLDLPPVSFVDHLKFESLRGEVHQLPQTQGPILLPQDTKSYTAYGPVLSLVRHAHLRVNHPTVP
jgi:hypothetical protein